jgi:hypothetical protein
MISQKKTNWLCTRESIPTMMEFCALPISHEESIWLCIKEWVVHGKFWVLSSLWVDLKEASRK